ncbi:Uncharacterised protein [Shigella sonnei]|nr:Uncharacterised protein [Shigella sonnei]
MIVNPVIRPLVVIITAPAPFSAVAPPVNQARTCLIFGRVMMFSIVMRPVSQRDFSIPTDVKYPWRRQWPCPPDNHGILH